MTSEEVVSLLHSRGLTDREIAAVFSAARNERTRPMTADRSHPNCWTGDHYQHACHQPSGRPCVDCGAPAGTPWGPYWCPDCDVKRLDRITAQLEWLVEGQQ